MTPTRFEGPKAANNKLPSFGNSIPTGIRILLEEAGPAEVAACPIAPVTSRTTNRARCHRKRFVLQPIPPRQTAARTPGPQTPDADAVQRGTGTDRDRASV